MEPLKLVKMANEIAAFFSAEKDRDVALEGIASHIRRFWDPRMRRQLFAWVDDHGGAGLGTLVAEALRVHRQSLLPSEHVP